MRGTRNYPWLPVAEAAVTLPSSSSSLLLPSLDEDIPLAKIPRLLVPFPATAEEDVTKTASPDADADFMTAVQPNASATSGPPSVSTLENDTELTRKVEPNVQRMHYSRGCITVAMSAGKIGLQLSQWLQFQFQRTRSRGHGSGTRSIYWTTAGFTDIGTSDQLNILQIGNAMNGCSSAVALGLSQRNPKHLPGDGCDDSNGFADSRPRRHPRNAAQQKHELVCKSCARSGSNDYK
jgi:hypothetical protein